MKWFLKSLGQAGTQSLPWGVGGSWGVVTTMCNACRFVQGCKSLILVSECSGRKATVFIRYLWGLFLKKHLKGLSWPIWSQIKLEPRPGWSFLGGIIQIDHWSYSQYWTGTSGQQRLIRGVFSNANGIHHFLTTRWHSPHVPWTNYGPILASTTSITDLFEWQFPPTSPGNLQSPTEVLARLPTFSVSGREICQFVPFPLIQCCLSRWSRHCPFTTPSRGKGGLYSNDVIGYCPQNTLSLHFHLIQVCHWLLLWIVVFSIKTY